MKQLILCSGHQVLVAGFRSIAETGGYLQVSVCRDETALREMLAGMLPEILLLDVGSGVTLDLIRDLRTLAAGCAVILWVDNTSQGYCRQALALGVLGILTKDASPEEYVDCLDQVSHGHIWIERHLGSKLLRTNQIGLTPRERQLMALLAQGLRNKEIAWRLGIGEGTVKVYFSRLFDKTGASDRYELALIALKNLACEQFGAGDSADATPASVNRRFLLPEYVSLENDAVYAA